MDPCDVVILIPFDQCGIYGAFVSSSLALIYSFMFSRSQIVHQTPMPIPHGHMFRSSVVILPKQYQGVCLT